MDRMALLHYRKRNQFGNLYNSHTNSSNGTSANFSFFIFYFTLILRVANNAGGFFCGGTLIHENYVLTGLFVCFFVVSSFVIYELLFTDQNTIVDRCFFHFSAAHCVRGPSTASDHEYDIDFVRIGGLDLRTDPRCEKVRNVYWVPCFIYSSP